jgi:Rho GDP-dissociation inhibitor
VTKLTRRVVEQVTVESLFLTSATLPPGKTISLDLLDKAHLADLKKNPITIKEGIEYG